MTLEEYAKALRRLAERYPDKEVWFSSDSEGNSFQRVEYEPSIQYLRPQNVQCGRIDEIINGRDLQEELEEGEKVEDFQLIILLN